MPLKTHKTSQTRLIKRCCTAALQLALLIALAPMAQAQTKPDIPKSADHPVISRFPGAYISEYEQVNFDEFKLPLGKVAADGVPAQSAQVEGKVTRIVYKTPAPRTVLEIYKNFEGALNKGGFKILYACADAECGGTSTGPTQLAAVGQEDWVWSKGRRYLAAKRSGASGDVYVTIQVGQWSDLTLGTDTVLFVAETKAMEAGLVKVDAKAINDNLASQGHASIYGIFFDTAKTDVKPESDPQLQDIAQLLKSSPALKLLVVGHTDNVGALAANMQLSRNRAEAVVAALTSRYGIAAARLSAQGAGPLAPVASNQTDDGRVKNRRVELVQQ